MVPELDDEFAKDLGNFENLEALRARSGETSSTKRCTRPNGMPAATC